MPDAHGNADVAQMFLAPAPVHITPQMAELFELKLREAEVDEPVRAAAMSTIMQAEHDVDQEKVCWRRCRSHHLPM